MHTYMACRLVFGAAGLLPVDAKMTRFATSPLAYFDLKATSGLPTTDPEGSSGNTN